MKFIIHLLVISLMFPFVIYANEDPIVLGYSNVSKATAYSNGRRIVRTSGADTLERIYVFFQDSIDYRPVIKTAHSVDETTWSQPAVFDYGLYPSVAISSDDVYYVAYVSENQKRIVVKGNGNTLSIDPDNADVCKYPAIETTSDGVHVVWQQTSTDDETESIYYQLLNRDLTNPLSRIVQLSSDSTDSRFATLGGCLEFSDDFVYVFWTDSSLHDTKTTIQYCCVDSVGIQSDSLLVEPRAVPDTDNMTNPSISVRESAIIMVCAGSQSHNLYTSAYVVSESKHIMPLSSPKEYSTSISPFPSADDVYLHSCAVVWQDSDGVRYGQVTDDTIITIPPLSVSVNTTSRYPNVCYKTFRFDYFDVVWTEGDAPPYKIMYRRMDKRYSPLNVSIQRYHYGRLPESDVYVLVDGYYKNEYKDGVYASGGTTPYEWKLIDGDLPSGLSIDFETFRARVTGSPDASGHYEITITVEDSSIPTTSDTAKLVANIINTKPLLISADSISIHRGEQFSYSPQAYDAENNDIFFEFEDYPKWMNASDSEISGFIPSDANDTSFVVVASDGELDDTMKVSLYLPTGIPICGTSTTLIEPTLFQNYPNPFNSQTTIGFVLGSQTEVNISVYNISGKLIDRLIQGKLASGYHSITWNAKESPTGVYVLKFQAGNATKVKKCLYIK